MKEESEIRDRLDTFSRRLESDVEVHQEWCEGQRDALLWVLEEFDNDVVLAEETHD